ncbi:hypothetical protein C1X05_02835 [Laceyella sacchari]|jgi:hypothetical protein|uniref:Anchor n=1 Tax=Laceyella tengchongensis TaxID=574699 RepID=A0AA45WIB9_9BACL|nr:hypothetical protein [Laceyella tengchongensis]AUS07865.1 hypothetical protein C1X05_02835 [Laceyella sacchari]MRG29295.1 hypothetical protein [Laceyella tengchongensis]SMP00343.1 anchor [Laceyella tengchongensis]
MKDPKQILDSWRTDVHSRNIYSNLLRQFDLEYPNQKGNRRRPKSFAARNPNHTAAALSLCLVTGLTMGVGSAFAENEVGPDTNQPVDLPPSKASVTQEQPAPERKNVGLERRIEDRRPQEVEIPKKPQVQQHQPDEVKSTSPELPPSEEKPREVVAEKEKSQPTSESEQPARKDQITNNHLSSHHSPKLNQSEQTMKPQKESKQHPSTNQHIEEPVRVVEGEVSLEAFSTEKKDAGTKQDAIKTTADTRSTELPKTMDGGQLPNTAGNDLNGVLIGGATALIGSLYAFRRSRVKRS